MTKSIFKKLLVLSLILSMVLSLVACGNNNPQDGNSGNNNYSSGTFTGVGNGLHGEIKVEVKVEDGIITDINVLEQDENPILGKSAFEGITETVLLTNGTDVDIVTGATFSSQGMIEAIKDALEKDNVVLAPAKSNNEATDNRDLKDSTYDVVVIGAGGAGLSAAIEAKTNGAKNVILIEKMPFAGGNTLLSYAELASAGNWLQKEKGIEDSNEQFAKEMWEGGGKLARKEIVDTVVNNAVDATLWLRDTIGVVYQDYLVHEGGHSVPRAVEPVDLGPGMIEPLLAKAEEHGVDIVYNTKAEELIVNDAGRVTGVKVSNNGKTAIITANNGVILATGGFGANVEMRQKYNTRWKTLDETVQTTNSPAIVGDGIIMAEKIGAQLEGMEHIQLYPFNNPITGVFYGIEAPSWSGEGIIYVNENGNRFVNEVAMRDVRAEGILAQDGYVYAIYNQEVADRLNMEEKFAAEYAKCLEDGVFYKAETLEEIADYFEIDATNLVETMNNYNKYMTEGLDPEFNRTTSMVPMNKGPWFILKGVVSVHHTMGGVMIDTESHVLNADGKVIQGLYAAGEVTGSVHGNNRVGTCAITDITVFGRIAGKNAALNK